MNWMDYQYPSNMANNRLAIVGDQNSLYTTKYGNDPNGNVISDQAPDITAITYDWRNRATKMVDGANTYLYRYDAAGLRNFRKVIPANGPTRVEFFIGGMVIDPNGTILRLDISDRYAETKIAFHAFTMPLPPVNHPATEGYPFKNCTFKQWQERIHPGKCAA